jgi:hypothetical protein
MEGPTLQQDIGLVLGFFTSVVTVTGLWAIFCPPVAQAYQKMAKNMYSLLPTTGVVVEDNGHDTKRIVLPLPNINRSGNSRSPSNSSDEYKKIKVFRAVNAAPTSQTGNTTQGCCAAPASSSTVASGSGTRIQFENSSLHAGGSACSSPKAAGLGAPSA